MLYVQTPAEDADTIALDKQRHLINNFKMATQLGAEIIKAESRTIARTIVSVAQQRGITTVCIGRPHLSLFKVILSSTIFSELLNKLGIANIDLVILS